MTTPLRDRITPLILALAMTSAVLASAIALPGAALAEDTQFDKVRAKIAAFVVDRMEKLGGSRIIYKVDTKDPIASFRFNGRGTRRFAHITEENIGKPFAIVLDGKVISTPVIREPITGGSGQISGNFTP